MNGQPPFYPPHGMPPGPPPRGPPFPPGAMPMMAPPMGYPPPYGMPMPAPGMLPPGPPPGRPPFPLPSMGGALPPPVLPAEDPANWSEHAAADGRTYYHNKVTKVSTYDRPACLDKDKQQAAAAAAKADGAGPGAAGAKKPPGPPALPPCKWKEYKTAEGKTYYSDGSKSLWEEPAELTEHKKKLAELEAAADKIEVVAVTKAEDRRPPPAETIELVDDDDERSGAGGAAGAVNGTAASGKGEGLAGVVAAAAVKEEPPDEPADAVAAFKQLLYEKGVSSTVKWGEVAKLLGKEALWGSLKTGEKKQAFAEYQTKRMKEEREERRLRARKAKDGFLKLLAETVEVDSKLRWRDAEELLKDDPRFKAPELSEHDKEDIFAEFVSELAKREKEEKALNKQAFLALLRQLAASGKVTRDMAWREAQALLGELPGAEERRLLDLVDEVDRRHAFEDLQLELEAAHRERKRREKEERKRVEEERRKAFTARLQALAEEGLIDMDSRWKALKPTIETEEVYTSMVGQGGATPAELFDKFVDALQDRFAEDKRRLRDFLPRASPVAPDWAYEDFVGRIEKALVDADGEKEEENKRLKEFREMLAGRPKHVKAAFKDLHARAVKDREEEARRKAKREERYRDLLLEYYWRSDHIGTAWEEAQKDLSRHSAYRDLDGEERQRLFDEHMASLEAKLQKKTKHRKELLKKEKGAKEEGGKASKKRKKSGKDDASSSSSSDSSSSSSSSDDSSSGSDSDSSAASDSPKKKKKGSKDKDKDGGGKKHARKASGDSSSSKRKRDGGAGDGDDGKDKAKKSSSRRDRSRSRSRGRSRSRSADRKSKKARARSGSRSD